MSSCSPQRAVAAAYSLHTSVVQDDEHSTVLALFMFLLPEKTLFHLFFRTPPHPISCYHHCTINFCRILCPPTCHLTLLQWSKILKKLVIPLFPSHACANAHVQTTAALAADLHSQAEVCHWFQETPTCLTFVYLVLQASKLVCVSMLLNITLMGLLV